MLGTLRLVVTLSALSGCTRATAHRAVALLFLIVLPAVGQNNPRKTIKTVDDHCIAISKQVDAMDDVEEDTHISDVPVAERPKLVEYMTSLRALRRAIRRDCCDAKDLKSARAATDRDLRKSAQLTDEMLAYAHHAIAEGI